MVETNCEVMVKKLNQKEQDMLAVGLIIDVFLQVLQAAESVAMVKFCRREANTMPIIWRT